MRFLSAVSAAAALLAGTVNAEAQSVLSEASSASSSVVESSTSSAAELPTFTVCFLSSYLLAVVLLTLSRTADHHQSRLLGAVHK